jgi:hypothetical protein
MMTDTMSCTDTTGLELLDPGEWQHRRDDHTHTADELTAAHRARRSRGERHPVWDFMFTYYPTKPGQLRRWTPGAGVGLLLPGDADRSVLPGPEKFHHLIHTAQGEVWTLDTGAFFTARGRAVTFLHSLLQATASRTPRFSCFGMHEWAMVYRDRPRHPEPLRLGAAGTDRVVEDNRITCTHFDAFRFFTPQAVPHNDRTPTRENQRQMEQPGCLHATMDLYKWATKLGPLVPGDLWLDTFRLACDVRATDMEASPYDLRDWGHEPVEVETPAGRAEYARRQKGFATRGQQLRQRMVALIETAYPDLATTTGGDRQ